MAMNGRCLKIAFSVFCLALLAWILNWRHLVVRDILRPKISFEHTLRLLSDVSVPASHPDTTVHYKDVPEEAAPPSRWLLLPSLASPHLCSQIANTFADWQLLVLDVVRADANESMDGCPVYQWNISKGEATSNYTQLLQAALYAIQGGAEVLYIAPSETIHSACDIPPLYVDEDYRGLVTAAGTSEKSVSVSDYYACRTASDPRRKYSKTKKYQLKSHKTPALQIPIWPPCEKTFPPVTVQEGLFLSDVVVKRGLFHKSSFWSLPVVELSSLLQASAWSILIQKLLWIIGDRVMLTNGYDASYLQEDRGLQFPTVHNNPGSPSSVRKHTSKLMQTLQDVSCDMVDFNSCLLVLISYGERLGKNMFIQKENFLTWLSDLRDAGWVFPLVNNSSYLPSQSIKYVVELTEAVQRKSSQNMSVILNCAAMKSLYIKTCGANLLPSTPDQSYRVIPHMSSPGKRALLEASLNKTMQSYQYGQPHDKEKTILRPSLLDNGIAHTEKMSSLDNRTQPLVLSSDTEAHGREAPVIAGTDAPRMDDILLVVAFNNPHYEALPYVELLYRPYFPHILYCGPGHPEIKHVPGLSRFQFSFVSYGGTPEGHLPGSFNYECLALAAGMHWNVRGYLLIGDDVLLMPNSVASLSRDHVWFLPPSQVSIGGLDRMEECFMGACHSNRELLQVSYRSQTEAVLQQLKQNQAQQGPLANCYHTLLSLVGENEFFTSYADVAYLPRRLSQDFQQLVQMFRQEEVFLEVALPTILMCLEPFKNIVEFPGQINWDFSRNQPWLYVTELYRKQLYFLHPTKWGFLAQGDSNFTKFYCDVIQSEGMDYSFNCCDGISRCL